MAFVFRTNHRAAISDINVTPLVDVMLVLLIIFMVTAPMMQEGITVDLPETKGEPLSRKQQTEEIVISVSGQGNIFFNDVAVKEENLPAKIIEITQNRPKSEVFLRADKTVQYGVVARIMGVLMAAGVKNLNFITTPTEESKPAR